MMKNLFEQSRSHWVRYDHYELKAAEDGNGTSPPARMQSRMSTIR